jgi:hypothetical protein
LNTTDNTGLIHESFNAWDEGGFKKYSHSGSYANDVGIKMMLFHGEKVPTRGLGLVGQTDYLEKLS